MYLEKIVTNSECETECYDRCKLLLPANLQAPHRRYMAEILPIRHKILSNQSIQAPHNAHIFVIINLISEHSWIKFGNTVIGSEPGSLEGGVHMVWELF